MIFSATIWSISSIPSKYKESQAGPTRTRKAAKVRSTKNLTKSYRQSFSSSVSLLGWISLVAIVAALLLPMGAEGRLRLLHQTTTKRGDDGCEIRNKPVAQVFDKICDMCYEMYKVEMPNLKIECRANCFDNDKFKLCLRQYSPGMSSPPVRRRSQRRHF